ncbi:putative Nuclear factor kappa-B-binding protein [Hibiscus syriacus]|uniref:Nuclear factor kappa-B-binding protein n=1 Tax=Hibiscus syriacus TaxID=106335 RepID=A0A6A3ACH6_HIBSY|nr:putative Nuclear factor kappa-B-binding protein [Hibiscus syriacus]
MQFIYVLPGWEGSAADGRILRDAISRRNGLNVPQGCYYLCDVGYTNGEGFLAPYRGQRYHLNDWREGHQPTTLKKYFNMKHSQARNCIERCFGILKARWAILREKSFYPVKTQCRLISACCLLHNFIRSEMPIDPIESDYTEDSSHVEEINESHPTDVGLRNKSFPFFDDFVHIFGKERAAGTTADALKHINVEDNAFIDVLLEEKRVRDSESREDVGASTCQTSDATASSPTMKKVASKKRSRSDDGLTELVQEISKFGAAYRETAKEIKDITALLKKEVEGNDQRISIFTEIMKIEGMSTNEILTIGEYINKDAHKFRIGCLCVGFGNLTATAKNIPPGVEEPKSPKGADILVKATSNCCSMLLDRCCCMCFIQACTRNHGGGISEAVLCAGKSLSNRTGNEIWELQLLTNNIRRIEGIRLSAGYVQESTLLKQIMGDGGNNPDFTVRYRQGFGRWLSMEDKMASDRRIERDGKAEPDKALSTEEEDPSEPSDSPWVTGENAGPLLAAAGHLY